jgi:hypothetical protein
MDKNKIERIHLYDDEYIELPYPIDSDEFDLDGPYLLNRILFYEIQCIDDKLNELLQKLKRKKNDLGRISTDEIFNL